MSGKDKERKCHEEEGLLFCSEVGFVSKILKFNENVKIKLKILIICEQ